MEYAIAIAVILIFATLSYFTKTKERESFDKYLDNDSYQDNALNFAKSLELPLQHGKKQYEIKTYLKTAKRTLALTKKLSKVSGGSISDFNFAVYKTLNQSKFILKPESTDDFETLSELPSFKKDARIIEILDFFLSSSAYSIDENRLTFLFDCINRYRTVTYSELKAARQACRYILYRKLFHICSRVITLNKLAKYAQKMSKRPKSYTESPKFKSLRKNYLFLSLCAEYTLEECQIGDIMLSDVKKNTLKTLNNVLAAIKKVEAVDFLSLYKPLALLNRFDTFFDASNVEKDAFLTELNEQSARQNMDEYAYAFSLYKYIGRVKPPLPTGKKLKAGTYSIFFFNQKNDMLMLARALNSPALMSLYFGTIKKTKKQNTGESILENVKFENSYASIGKDFAADFGITLADGVLRMNPRFNSSVEQANLKFTYNGVLHELTVSNVDTDIGIKKTEDESFDSSKVNVNGTDMRGVYSFKLTDKPLEVKYYIPPKKNDRFKAES